MNQEVIVIPKLSSNLALIGGLITGLPGLGIGAAVILLNKIIPGEGDIIGSVASTRYKITGSIDDPQVEVIEQSGEVEGEEKQEQPTEQRADNKILP